MLSGSRFLILFNVVPFVITGPQEGICNWCGQLGGRLVGKGVIIVTCADMSPVKNVITCRHLGPTFWGYFELYIRSILALLCGFLHALFSLQINPIMNIIMMIPTKTLAPKISHKHHSLPPGDSLHHGDCRLIYEGDATNIANFCCQITTEQFDKVQLTQKHVGIIMLIKRVGYRPCPIVMGFKVGMHVSVSGLQCFVGFSRGVSIFILSYW